jgi:ABC-type polysaccharide/polyol phosphate transport system ATPase subunit
LRRGETLGLIGLNGSGKSTLLKLINGIYLPDHGEINIEGEVGGLIELNSGMQPALSGRDNIFIKGALLGRSRVEMMGLYNKIVEFAELDDFINSPVKNYSSGMKMRLGFSIAIHMQPNILLMDEVMAVGDFRFQQKCLDRVNEMRETMSTIFVSHSMNQIALFCDHVIVLDKGDVVFRGEPEAAIKYYMSEIEEKKESAKKVQATNPFYGVYGDIFINNNKITDVKHEWVTQTGQSTVELFQTLKLEFSFRLLYEPRELQIGVPVWSVEEQKIVAAFPYDLLKEPEIKINADGVVVGELEFSCYLNPGPYISSFNVKDGPEFLYRLPSNEFKVEHGPRVFGYVTLPHQWKFFDLTTKQEAQTSSP